MNNYMLFTFLITPVAVILQYLCHLKLLKGLKQVWRVVGVQTVDRGTSLKKLSNEFGVRLSTVCHLKNLKE
jgi:hypothetical protein